MDKLKLIALRQENCGYNPEKAIDVYDEVVQVDDFTLQCTYEEHTQIYTKVNVKNEIEFIEQYPNTVGVVFLNDFYIQD
jgi:hypothetical protein